MSSLWWMKISCALRKLSRKKVPKEFSQVEKVFPSLYWKLKFFHIFILLSRRKLKIEIFLWIVGLKIYVSKFVWSLQFNLNVCNVQRSAGVQFTCALIFILCCFKVKKIWKSFFHTQKFLSVNLHSLWIAQKSFATFFGTNSFWT